MNPATISATLIFLGGVGLGAFIATVFFLVLIKALSRKSSGETDKTLKLMAERNALDAKKVACLEHLAEWSNHNFSK